MNFEHTKDKNVEFKCNQNKDVVPFKVQLAQIKDMDSFTDYFLTCHEYSFINYKKIEVGMKEYILNFVKELWYLNDLEKIWYGVYLKHQQQMIHGLNFSYMESSIKTTLQNIDNLNVDMLNFQSKTFNNLLLIEGLKPLVLRPIFSMEDENSDFYLIKTGLDDFTCILDKYKEYLLDEELIEFHILDTEITNKYLVENCTYIETWAFKLNSFLVDVILPKLQNSLDELAEFLNDEKESSTDKVEKVLKRVLDKELFIEFIDETIVNIIDVDKIDDKKLKEVFDDLIEATLNVLDSLIFKYLLFILN